MPGRDHPLSLIFPRPQRLEVTADRVDLSGELRIEAAALPDRAAHLIDHLRQQLEGLGGTRISLRVDADQKKCQAYRMELAPSGVELSGSDEAGLFYGISTLVQLFRLRAEGQDALPGLRITDWPDFTHRGLMLDVSRDRVPTTQTLLQLVDLAAGLKINQLQLYMEHTFAYQGHEAVWREASPLSGEEIQTLDAYCRRRFVELVPNQNSFGHLHRWLKHEPYRALAECPEGIEHPFSEQREPYSLCPVDPGSLALLEDLFDQLLVHFSSRNFNVGMDETLDLGCGRSAAACDKQSKGRVYLEFLQKVHRLVSQRGRKMQFWGDIILLHPELIGELPGDATALEWGYEAGHPFAEHGELFARAGLEFYVCPGTSSWNSIAGRTDNALQNVSQAALHGRARGASGLLVTDWGDNGHLQPLPVSYLGLAAAAGCSWNVACAQQVNELDWPSLLDRHVFMDHRGGKGRVAHDLGNAYLQTGTLVPNGTLLFRLLTRTGSFPQKLQSLSVKKLEQTLRNIDSVTTSFFGESDLVTEELSWVADMLRLACRIGLARAEVGLDRPLEAIFATRKRRLALELEPLIQRHRQLWLRRSRPGGLKDSAGRLERVLSCLR